MKLSKEIRSQINKVDTDAANLIEMLDDEHPFEEKLTDLLNALAEVQNEITETQEAQGWLNEDPEMDELNAEMKFYDENPLI